MRQFFGIVLILAIGLVVSHRWFGKAKGWGGARFFYLTGEEFLLLGLLLGPQASNLIDRSTLVSLEPFVGLGLGYIGFVFGMQFRLTDLAKVPLDYYRASALFNLHNVIALFVPLYLGLHVLHPVGGVELLPVVTALVATSLGTSTSFLFLVERRTTLGRSDAFRFMRFSSVFDDLLGILVFGVAICLLRSAGGEGGYAPGVGGWLVVCVLLGTLFGVLLLMAGRMRLDDRELLLVLVGLVLMSGGLAMYLRLSPLLTNLLAGFIFCNAYAGTPRFHKLLLKVEKPIYLFMLVLAGALWRIDWDGLLVLVPLFVLARALGKSVGGRFASLALGGSAAQGSRFGLALTAQSEMAVAMMVNLMVLHDTPMARLAVSAVFIAVVVNDMISSAYFTWQYKNS